MKILRLLPIAAIACLAVSCQNANNGTLTENSTPTDSLMYYLGQMNAADYLREAARDTVMKDQGQKDVYMNGIRAGLAALKEGNETYNKGYMLGMQMASQMISFSEQMDVKINREAYASSLEKALRADTMPNMGIVQAEFRKVMQNIENAKEEKDKVASQESLSQAAASASLPKINDDLYGKVTNATDSAALTDGEEVNVECQVTKIDGETISLPLPSKGNIGNKRNFPEVVSAALLTLKNGESGEFMTSAHALLGGRAKQMGLEPADALKFTLKASLVPQEENKEEGK
ncbi:MAG: hypothetical protein J1F16_03830 [Muribaculaceae bacterium]|nr:hypothetical protein [Muribaculaceae bacterium]